MKLVLLLFLFGCSTASFAVSPDSSSPADLSALADLAVPADLSAASDLSSLSDLGFAPAAHPPLPQLINNAGDVLTDVRLVSVVSSGDPMQQTLFDFGDALVKSAWWTTVGADYGLGAAAGALSISGPPVDAGTNLTGPQIKSYLTALATGGAAPDGHSVYVLYLPDKVGILDNQMRLIGGCVAFHFANFSAQGDVWAVVKRCDTSGNAETYLASHEIAEGCADAAAGKGWSLPFAPSGTPPPMQDVWAVAEGHEASDLCQGAGTAVEGGFSYSRIWSNSAAAAGGDPCVPSLPGPYVNVSSSMEWVAATPGTDTLIPVTGWSSAPVADWSVSAGIRGYSGPSPSPSLDGATINNGKQLTLRVSMPGAVSGNWAAVRLLSVQPASAKEQAIWIVGVYYP
jgi:hypothetical protein